MVHYHCSYSRSPGLQAPRTVPLDCGDDDTVDGVGAFWKTGHDGAIQSLLEIRITTDRGRVK